MTRPREFDAVCFDLDDTLFPYAAYARAGLSHAADYLADEVGREVHDELRELYFEDGVRGETFDRVVDRYGDVPDDVVSELIEAYHRAEGPLEPYPETVEVLRTLAGTYRLGLVTDGRNGAAKMRRLELEEFFDATLVTYPTGSTKRERQPFEEILEALSVDPVRTAYVGDDPRVDFAVPNELGMATVRVRRGRYTDLEADGDPAAPDAEIDSLRALPGLLTDLAARGSAES